MAIGDIPPTKPAHGVIATRPATAPDAAPSVVACPVSQTLDRPASPSIAAGRGQVRVHERLRRDDRSPASAEPALKPNQPNHRMPVPMSVSGQRVRRHRVLRPSASAPEHEHRGEGRDPGVDVHDRAAGEVERAALEQPALGREDPVRDRRVHEDRPQTRGTTPRRAKRMRSAIAPVISAGVITANIIWYAMNSSGGIVSDEARRRGRRRVVQPREVEVADPARSVPPNASE